MMPEELNIVPRSIRRSSFVNALSLYLLAFLITHVSYLFITNTIAHAFGIDTSFNYYKVEYTTLTSSNLWSVDALVIMFLSGPFVSVLIAGIFSRLHFLSRSDQGYARLFYLYMYFVGLNYGIGAFLAGPISQQESWYALAWLNVPQIVMYLMAVVALLVMYYLGSVKTLFVYEASIYKNPNLPVNRQSWLLNALFYPWLLGAVVLILVFLPNITLYFSILFFTPIVFYISAFRQSKLMNETFEVEYPHENKILWLTILLVIIGFAAFRILFS